MSSALRVKMKLFFSPQSTPVISFQFSRVSSHQKLNWVAKSQSNRNGKVVGRERKKVLELIKAKCFCVLEVQALCKGAVCDDNHENGEEDEDNDGDVKIK